MRKYVGGKRLVGEGVGVGWGGEKNARDATDIFLAF